MPQIQINSANIDAFSFSAVFDLYNRTVLFDTSATTYNGSGASNVVGISFLLKDQDGVVLTPAIDWGSPQIPDPATEDTYTLDLSDLNFAFLYQQYEIVGYIKDQNGIVYGTIPVYKKVCEPVNVNESGYVSGMFQIIPDCTSNVLTVKDLTVYAYAGKKYSSIDKDGTLYYPTGTISPVEFGATPFSNNEIFSGENRINCNSVAQYDLLDQIFVNVTYITDQVFPVTCTNVLGDLACCLVGIQNTALANCNNAIGANARQQQNEVAFALMTALLKQTNGQDASTEVAYIKKTLNCDCGATSIRQNEFTPVNPAVNSIVLVGAGDTNVGAATITGNTKKYTISSSSYVVAKGNVSDLAWTISLDTTSPYVVKYKITFDYTVMAGYILTAIGGQSNGALKTQLNALITATSNIDLSNLNGKCIIDLSAINYFLSQIVPSTTALVKSILIGATTHNAPALLYVNNTTGIEAWLNGLGLGTYDASFSNGVSGAYINVLTLNNTNSPVNVILTINGTDTTVLFQKTNTSLIAFLQALVDYLCGLTTLQVALAQNLNICQFDYNGSVIVNTLQSTQTQKEFNSTTAGAICNIVQRINTLTGVTCDKIKALFQAYPNAIFDNSTDSFMANVAGNCTALTGQQAALGIIAAINAYSDVKAAFCAINCAVPATCPEVAGLNLAMSGDNIGLYGITWSVTPAASQTVTVKYRVNGTTPWNVATNGLVIFPNGNISGTSPYLITGVSADTTYDVQVLNNCGGVGFIQQITTPSGTIYSGDFLLNNVLYSLCGGDPVVLYSSAPFGTGVTMYTDAGLTTIVTGYIYIASALDGIIFEINTSTGVVGSPTGNVCNTGNPGSYRIGNNTGTICAQPIVTLYTNGSFAVSKILYYDSALTTPVTTYSYVFNISDDNIYNLNTLSGVVGVDTTLGCGTTELTGSISSGTKTITLNFDAVTLCGDNISLQGSWSDGVTPGTWYISYAVGSGATTGGAQNVLDSITNVPLTTGQVITSIDGGNPWNGAMCSGTVILTLTNPLP